MVWWRVSRCMLWTWRHWWSIVCERVEETCLLDDIIDINIRRYTNTHIELTGHGYNQVEAPTASQEEAVAYHMVSFVSQREVHYYCYYQTAPREQQLEVP